MKQTIDIEQTSLLKTGILPKQGAPYALVALSISHVDAMLALQDNVLTVLQNHEQDYVRVRTKEYLENHFNKNNAAFGIVHDGKLIAYSMMLMPTRANPDTGLDNFSLPAKPEKIAVFQSTVVHPDYRGNSLMKILIEARALLAHQLGRTHIISRVSAGNHHSWSALMKAGITFHSLMVDPVTGSQRINMHAETRTLIKKTLQKNFNTKAPKAAVFINRTQTDTYAKLLTQGYRGINYDPTTQNIAFVMPRKALRAVTP